MFCEECGHPLHEGAQFCGSCGHTAGAVDAAVGGAAGPPSGPPAGASGSDRNPKLIVGLVAALVVAAIALVVLGVLVLGGGGDEKASKKDREVLLESTASVGSAPFTPDLQPVAATTPTTVTTAPTATTVPATTGRVAQGPFGGTGDNTLCDRELLVQFLTTPGNAGIAQEWARVLGIRVADIPGYVRALIPTTLTADARVTNHTFQNGRAVGYQAVLERGTAVLVDTNGRLIARCRCGNPLLPPQEVSRPIYTGPKWEGFDPTVIVVVVPSPTPVYPPGGVGTLPQSTTTTRPSTSTTTTTASERGADAAVALLRTNIESCYQSVAAGGGGDITFEGGSLEAFLGALQYQATPSGVAGTYRVVVAYPPTGEFATFDVTPGTGEITPVDETALEFGPICSNLA